MSDVARKFIEGLKVTREEYEYAVSHGMMKGKGTYEGLLATYYEDDVRHGYICPEHVNRRHTANADGFGGKEPTEWMCGWGLHAEDMKPEFLTDINRFFLVYAFGPEIIDKIGVPVKP